MFAPNIRDLAQQQKNTYECHPLYVPEERIYIRLDYKGLSLTAIKKTFKYSCRHIGARQAPPSDFIIID